MNPVPADKRPVDLFLGVLVSSYYHCVAVLPQQEIVAFCPVTEHELLESKIKAGVERPGLQIGRAAHILLILSNDLSVIRAKGRDFPAARIRV